MAPGQLTVKDVNTVSNSAMKVSAISADLSIFLKKWANPGPFFFIFVFSLQLTVNIQYKLLPMTGFEPRTSGVGSNRSTN